MNDLLKRKLRPLAVILSISFAFTLTGCIGDNLDDCPTSVSLEFSYTHNRDRVDYFRAQVDYLDLYLYNASDGSFVDHMRVEQTELTGGNTLTYDNLTPGDYTVVAWGNKDASDYDIQYDTTLDEMRLELRHDGQGNVERGQSHLFHGTADFSVKWGQSDELVSVALIKNTHNVSIVITETGNPSPVAITDYTVSLTGSNGDYLYNNLKPADSEVLNYMPAYSTPGPSSSRFQADFRVMRLFVGDDMRYQVKGRNGEILYDKLLTSTLTSENTDYNTTADLDREDEYIIYLDVDRSGGAYSMSIVRVNEWAVTEQGGIIN